MARVYVSSTFSDLKDYRERVRLALRRIGHVDVAMEYYAAQDERPVGKCLADVDSCDVYVGIFAWRYGWVPGKENPDGHSITEMEYRHAVRKGKTCLIFLLSEEADWPHAFHDRDWGPIERLREELSEAHTAAHFTSADDLCRLVVEAMHGLNLPADAAQTPAAPVSHNLPQPTYGVFIGRNEDLQRVMEGLKSRYPLVTIEGFAGIGKTSLALETGYICLGKVASPVGEPARFDYVVWVSADGKEQEHWLPEVLDEVLSTVAMGANPLTIPGVSERQMRKVDELLRANKVLIIFDNFDRDPELLEWMVHVPADSKVLITSRVHQVQKAWDIHLRGLEPPEALNLIRQLAREKGLRWLELETGPDELSSLAAVTGGNPHALVLTVGLLAGGMIGLSEVRNQIYNSSMQEVFENLYSYSWGKISQDARDVLSVIPLFVSEGSKGSSGQQPPHRVGGISGKALHRVSGLREFEFDAALRMLVDYSLLEVLGGECRFSFHPMTREYAKEKLRANPRFEAEARERWSSYFLEFVREELAGAGPDKPYWNALVSDRMIALDAEWPLINEVLKWADQNGRDQLIYELVMLLVHYMDSRLLNQERIRYVKKAIKAAEDMGRAEQVALLRLDALGWTYVEEDLLDHAYDEITEGLRIARGLPDGSADKTDLIALGLAWQARVMIEKDGPAAAQESIQEALSLRCSAWIKTRVFMVAGDIELKKNNSRQALHYYQCAAEQIKEYDKEDGYEGHGYQVESRIGLAYLGIGGGLREARERFEMLRRQDKIAIGKLYGEYGLALVAYKENERDKARGMMKAIREELSPLSGSNLLQKLISKLFADLEREEADSGGEPGPARPEELSRVTS